MYTAELMPVNDIGKIICNLTDTENNTIVECSEDEFCSLVVDGEIVGFEKYTGHSQSKIMVEIMKLKKENYIVTGKIDRDFTTSTKITGYVFKDRYNNEYVLRLENALELIKTGLVTNAKINQNDNHIRSNNGDDLRTISHPSVDSSKYLTREEILKVMEKLTFEPR